MTKPELAKRISQLKQGEIIRINDNTGVELVVTKQDYNSYDLDVWYDGGLEDSITKLTLTKLFEQFDRLDLYYDNETGIEYIVKVEEAIMNKANLDMNMFTMEFGKMDVSTGEHFDKVYEEYNELDEAFEIYDYKEAEGYTTNEEDRKNLSNEALDMVQASISFVSHLIENDIMSNKDIEAWKIKLEDRKRKYLK
ncbi:hypothetical protein [Fusobacterium ulcerans]|uniref:hypothetical protein n=1 Tax=Fusobacterium ulcerans TaxID=861 RepID=UPI0010313041|nr:hypothetical protein [Fusobacterium ulcerans]